MQKIFEELLKDSSIEDIVLNPRGIFFCRSQKWTGPLKSEQCDSKHLNHFARSIAEYARVQLGALQPSVDALISLSDKERFRAHVICPPMIEEGPEITLRRIPPLKSFPLESFCKDILLRKKIENAVTKGQSILIAGATGSGKSTLLSSFFNYIPQNLRLLVLEDSPELTLPTALSSKLLAKPNRFGKRLGVTWELEELVFEALRMRPDRILLGECRGPEARALATLLQTGHKGIMTTLHAGSPQEALQRFEKLARESSAHLPENITKLWHLVLYIEKDAQGTRRIHDVLWNT